MTDDDKELVERLRMHRSWRTGDGDLSDAPHKAADRIEVLSGLFTNATYEAAEMMKEIERLRELLAAAYIELSGKEEHASDCATSNAPAMTPGRCDCD